ncbi:hypothetical protein HanRHA438_Chr16g0753251 [Helianthus annuus]|nr:hypothetical protein HanIR_Chr16g0805891 [Helianthus annuus]KAJ0835268.1 hypothetical protein HanRHA438_Chr16g0753251 [Helianthus annuus]
MDAHEWNESLDRIISTIAEMIDLLKNESRRWATSPIFSTPLPSPAAASPPPTVVIKPPPSTVATFAIVPPPTSKTTEVASASPNICPTKKINHPLNNKDGGFGSQFTKRRFLGTNGNTMHYLNVLLPTSEKPFSSNSSKDYSKVKGAKVCLLPEMLQKAFQTNTSRCITSSKPRPTPDEEEAEQRAVEIREWWPPWRFTKTAPNGIVRVEWRPPWVKFNPNVVLEDKDISSGRD